MKIRSSLPRPSSSTHSIAYFSRPPSSHAQSFRTHSHPHLATHPGEQLARADKCTTRHLFSASDLDTITRNAEVILDFHEKLVHRLRQVVSPFGISMTLDGILPQNGDHSSPIDVRRALNAVSTVFVHHVRSWSVSPLSPLILSHRRLVLTITSLSALLTRKRLTSFAKFNIDTLQNGTHSNCVVRLSLRKYANKTWPKTRCLAQSPEKTSPRGDTLCQLWMNSLTNI